MPIDAIGSERAAIRLYWRGSTTRLAKTLAVALLSLFVLGAPAAPAEDKPKGPTTGPTADAPSAELPARVETRHSIQTGSGTLDYRAIAETIGLTTPKGEPSASIFTVSYIAEPPGAQHDTAQPDPAQPDPARSRPGRSRPQPAGGVRLQRRPRRLGGVPASRRARAAHSRNAADRRGAEPAVHAGGQSAYLARLHRSGLCRSGRHRLQPRRGQGKRQGGQPGQAVLGGAQRPEFARRGRAALADPAPTLDLAGISRRRELWRAARRFARARAGARCRGRGQRPCPGFAGARHRAAASRHQQCDGCRRCSCRATRRPPPPSPKALQSSGRRKPSVSR